MSATFLAQDRRPQAYIGIGVVTALSGVVVLVRSYARWRLIRHFGWDDGLICLAMAFNILIMALSFQVLKYGAGRHIYVLKTAGMVQLYKWLVAAQLVYMLALYVCRISGLAFYARLNPLPRYRLYLWISFGFVTAVYITQTLIIALQCIPLEALWGAAEGKCMGSKAVFISTAVMTIVCDSLVLVLPLNIVFTVKASLTRKISLAVVLCFGVFIPRFIRSGAASYPLQSYRQAIQLEAPAFPRTSICRILSMIPAITKEDATWYFSVVMVWSDTEISTAIIALSLPALKGLFGLKFGGRSLPGSNVIDGSGHVSLKQLRSSGARPNVERRIFEGSNTRPNQASVTMGDNTSEEILWTGKEDDGIHVKKNVRVEIDHYSKTQA
ncbi:hypothetical protein UCRPC4_g04896 [Phaeomoniella chlamydospora]|uniref:Rhodopsin domain-containing protein n=1 Tax=Phaeomoniella chlamydospora TaxID=158046 RepID=A0A0G2E5Z6_PHACM|nr:hypothetical protein UCRPC4_g04896 [Phaeomoniella chlamydospora]